MRKSILLLAFTLLSLTTFASTGNTQADEKTAVATVARNYIESYYTADVARMQSALHPQFHKRTLHMAGGQLAIREDSVQTMLAGVRSGTGTKVPLNERVQKIEVMDVYRNAANVKVVTGRWTDYMLLSRYNGQWRVLDVVLQYSNESR
ncbi:MAG TPA: nuclear transport factor 2 family protein [Candidatus Angelobacter sp.]|nr:nuclear transport factor 2 family protein [Candidatus Angelobacter sp.]